MSLITRRSLLRGLFAAPAIVAAERLMPLRGVIMRPPPIFETGIYNIREVAAVKPFLMDGVEYYVMMVHPSWVAELEKP